MKRAILNLFAAVTLAVSGLSLAVEGVEPEAIPVNESAEQTTMPADTPSSASVPESTPVLKNARRDIPTKTNRSRTLDLRYCLELETNAAIAKCAGE